MTDRPQADVLPRLAALLSDALAEVLDHHDLTATAAALDRSDLDLHRDIDGWVHVRIGGPTGVVIRAHVLPLGEPAHARAPRPHPGPRERLAQVFGHPDG